MSSSEEYKRSLRVLKLGVVLLIMALVTSALAMYSVRESTSEYGTVGKGIYYLHNDTFEKTHLYCKRTLWLNSSDAHIVLIWNGSGYPSNITGSVKLNMPTNPSIKVTSGTLQYNYTITGVRYPYSSLVFPAFVFMIVGTAAVMAGYAKMKGAKS